MKRLGKALFWLVVLGWLSACGAAPTIAVERPQPETIDLQITPAIEHWLPLVADCAADIPEFGVFTHVLARAELSLEESDLILRLGERLETDPFVAVMGVEEIVVVAGEEVPVSVLSLESLGAIYGGQISDWADIPEVDGDANGQGGPILSLTYPEGHEIEILFRRAYLDDAPILTQAQVFSTVAFMQTWLAEHPAAIGYLLESQVPEGMRVVPITSEDPIPSAQYVLAITPGEPEGRLKALLACLQNVHPGLSPAD
jgi:hypothetical protein